MRKIVTCECENEVPKVEVINNFVKVLSNTLNSEIKIMCIEFLLSAGPWQFFKTYILVRALPVQCTQPCQLNEWIQDLAAGSKPCNDNNNKIRSSSLHSLSRKIIKFRFTSRFKHTIQIFIQILWQHAKKKIRKNIVKIYHLTHTSIISSKLVMIVS